jgi:hypothetical protein
MDTGTFMDLTDMGNMGDTKIIDIPFDFNYYGITYDSLTVCSNGWIAPGKTEHVDYMNWEINDFMGPMPLIAVFWDDLITLSNSSVVYHYNEQEHCFIIQWDNLILEYDQSPETFQIIIYDSEFYPTYSNDCMMKFQYKEFTNTDIGGSGNNFAHGFYSTIGIRNQTGRDGIQYTFNNKYSSGASELHNETALTILPSSFYSQNSNISFKFTEVIEQVPDGIYETGEIIFGKLEIGNWSTEELSNLNIELTSENEEINIIQNQFYVDELSSLLRKELDGYLVFEINNDANLNYLFNLDINGEVLDFQLPLNLQGSNLMIDDIFVYTENYEIEPGDNSFLCISVFNAGGQPSQSTTLNIIDNNTGVSIENNELMLPSLNSSERTIVKTLIGIDSGFDGISFVLSLILQNNSETIEIDKTIFIGEQTTFSKYSELTGTCTSSDINDYSDVNLKFGNFVYKPHGSGNFNHIIKEGIFDSQFSADGHKSVYEEIEIIEHNLQELIIDFELLPYPSDLVSEEVQNSNIRLEWNEVEENEDFIIDHYLIYRKKGDYPFLKIDTTSTNQYIDYNVTGGDYQYYVVGVYGEDESYPTNTVELSIVENEDINNPNETKLYGSYPNPFIANGTRSSEIVVKFALKEKSKSKIDIYNIKGQHVKCIADDEFDAGVHNVTWNGYDKSGKNTASGIYFISLDTPNKKQSMKMLKLK